MKKHYVKIGNFLRFNDGIQAVEERGAAEASMMLVFGAAGYGKSETLDHWATQNDAIYLRANVDWTPKYFLIELAKFLKTDVSGTAEQLFSRLLAKIAGEQIPIVIDEADHCLHNAAAVLEKVRDFADRTETLVILAGMEKIQGKIARHPQISSRIARAVEFGPASAEDTAKLCAELCEIPVARDLVAEIQRQSAGRVREILNAIAVVERTGMRGGKDEVTLADMAGQALTHDWQSRRPRVVKIAGGGVEMTKKTYSQYTHEEWLAEGARRFGEDMTAWKFVCPSCGYVTAARDWMDAGAPTGAIAFSCVGRWTGSNKAIFDKSGGPCNYAGGGLIGLNPVVVDVGGDEPIPVFDFAPAEQRGR